jgi:CRP/FNR family transcriptional regulator, nitrogen fixation regulation protein
MHVANAASIAADRQISIAGTGLLDELVALERIGTRHSYQRNEEVFADGDASDDWFRVVAGTVRTCRVLADGRRHVAGFHFAGDFFGIEGLALRSMSAEAVGDVVVMRYPRKAIERLAEANPGLARRLREMAFEGLADAQERMLLLGRKTAPERVASFLLEVAQRGRRERRVELPMSRYDIADYLGLTIETVSRTLSALKRAGAIALPSLHLVELLDRGSLAAVAGTA